MTLPGMLPKRLLQYSPGKNDVDVNHSTPVRAQEKDMEGLAH